MDDVETGLWLLIGRLRETGRPLGRTTLAPFAEIKLPDVAARFDALVVGLIEQGLIEGDAGAFGLTPEGEDRLASVSGQHSLNQWFYDAYYAAAASSVAHAEFCRRVYGLDLSQHGMADIEQLRIALGDLGARPGMRLLDFGCGDGRIAEHIADMTGAAVSGIDIASRAIAQARERTRTKSACLTFYAGDLATGAGELPAGPFEGIVSVDSFFFVPDQAALLDAFMQLLTPDGSMAIFYICSRDFPAAQTLLSRALIERDIPYRAHDFSAENTRHWQLKKQVLQQMEPLFRQEEAQHPGAMFLWRNRMAECDGGMEDMSRYLYIVQRR